ncbi:MAG: hypothetical protein PHX07_02970 [Candidatus Marinimicrobia bacterium]|nr:hypothetical protein [Candidatus Neomarinimicrobiota bacterium]MDD4961179.1 hypothetical protein [Candidatus Neomarinimicrobiota bacterium]MDD5709881.1 hypothetical protein [Candidatus Neomarinimicrobiota bacterium]
MKKVLLYALSVLAAIALILGCTGCDPNPDAVWELRLVPLSQTELAKAHPDENGNLWISASEMPESLAKPAAGADIDFGNVIATRTLQYVLMNVGNRDVYDVTFSAGDLTIYPEYIGVIPAQGEDGEIVALPIVSFIKEHVIPISGVGSMMDMSIGSFTDLLSLSYNYTLEDSTGIETFDVTDNYTVEGEKMGALIDILASGKDILDIALSTPEFYDLALMGTVLQINLSSSDMDTMVVQNNGNVPLRMRVINPYRYDAFDGSTTIDTIIQPGTEVNVSGFVRGEQFFEDTYDESKGSIIMLGDVRNQPYIFETVKELCIDGEMRLWFLESSY